MKNLRWAVGLVALAMSQKTWCHAILLITSKGKSRASHFLAQYYDSLPGQPFFSKQFPFPQCTKNVKRIRPDQELIEELIEEFIINLRANLTYASTRKNRPDHGSCLRNTRARLVFPVTTGVRSAQDKNTICYWCCSARINALKVSVKSAKNEKISKISI